MPHGHQVAAQPAPRGALAQIEQVLHAGARGVGLAVRRQLAHGLAAVDAVHVDGPQAGRRHALGHHVVEHGHPAHLRDQAGVEGQRVGAVDDLLGRLRRAGVAQRVDLHQQDVARAAQLHQRRQRGVAGVAAVPVGAAVDLRRLEQHRQAGRGHHRLRREPPAGEDHGAAGFHVGGVDEHLGLGQAGDALEVDLALQQLAQRVDVERVALVGREAPQRAWQRAQHQFGEAARPVAEGAERHHLVPDAGQGVARAFGRVAPGVAGGGPAVRQRDGVHRPGAGAADAFETQAAVGQQGIERAPGEGTMCTTPLQRQIRGLEHWHGG